MRPPKLDRILAADTTLQPVLAKAQDLRAFAGLLDGFLPPDLARQARVVNYRDGELVLVAASPAAAAKLRLLAPSLVNFFLKQRLQVNSVSLRVQPNASHKSDVAPRKSAHLSTLTLDRLRKLYKNMAPSPARDALGTLLEHQERTTPATPLPQTGPESPPRHKRRT